MVMSTPTGNPTNILGERMNHMGATKIPLRSKELIQDGESYEEEEGERGILDSVHEPFPVKAGVGEPRTSQYQAEEVKKAYERQ